MFRFRVHRELSLGHFVRTGAILLALSLGLRNPAHSWQPGDIAEGEEAVEGSSEHLQVTPAVQMTRNPSFNDSKENLWVGSVLRLRLAF